MVAAYRRWGHRVLATNARDPFGEADLVVADGSGRRVLVEVKTVSAGGDPFGRVDPAKERTLRRLASRHGARRIDVVGVIVDDGGVVIHAHHGW